MGNLSSSIYGLVDYLLLSFDDEFSLLFNFLFVNFFSLIVVTC